MPMQMGFRWYGEGNDKISLSDIRQIPGVSTIVWALHDKLPGEIWQPTEIQTVVDQITAAGFNADVVESVNVHDDIKIGLPTRDGYIENYIQTIRNLAPFGVKVICYNFMPIFDWTRSDLFHPVGDGSTALFYQKDMIQDDPKQMADYVMGFTEKYHMTFPGWEVSFLYVFNYYFLVQRDYPTFWTAKVKIKLQYAKYVCKFFYFVRYISRITVSVEHLALYPCRLHITVSGMPLLLFRGVYRGVF